MDDLVDTDGEDALLLLVHLDCTDLVVTSGYSHSRSDDLQLEHIGSLSSHYVQLGSCLYNNASYVPSCDDACIQCSHSGISYAFSVASVH